MIPTLVLENFAQAILSTESYNFFQPEKYENKFNIKRPLNKYQRL